ncbi:MAG: hypothetical protein HOE80_03165 [Candidatus Magasanikbacteria bacterium]|nr:hypothetical protein [Candidatus Magasanikbacteria bacterium]MBT4071698.1 hypothetical protein [Candidatus Magasanikbacteria bacterium]
MAGVFLFVSPVHAGFDMTTVADGLLSAIGWMLLGLAKIFIQLTIFSLKTFILVLGYNNYIDAPVVKLGWNMVRDLANMFFIVVLMIIAFGTILGIEQYEWRKTLVKVIIAAILVNFSNMILQLLIDVSQVFTITFLNAIAATAGGNLIDLFSFDKVLEISLGGSSDGYLTNERIDIEMFGASVMALVFAAMAMVMMTSYLVVALARMVALWVAIIFSPIAFLLGTLPLTKPYADQFWKEFFNHLIVAPIMVFFMWLAFATLGGEHGAYGHIYDKGKHPLGDTVDLEKVDLITGEKPGVSFNKAASWENMANFAVALAFLMIGIQQVSKTGATGAGMVTGAIDFAKKVGTIASGIAAARWIQGGVVGGVTDVVGDSAKWVGKSLPGVSHAIHGYKVGKERIKQGWYGSFGQGGLKKAGSLKKYEDLTEQIKERYTHEGAKTFGAKESLAHATVNAEIAKRHAEAEYGKIEGGIRIEFWKKQNERFEENLGEAEGDEVKKKREIEKAKLDENQVKQRELETSGEKRYKDQVEAKAREEIEELSRFRVGQNETQLKESIRNELGEDATEADIEAQFELEVTTQVEADIEAQLEGTIRGITNEEDRNKTVAEEKKNYLDSKSRLSLEERAVIADRVAETSAAKGDILPSVVLAEARAGAKKGKSEAEADVLLRTAKDIDRNRENKLGKYMREFEDSEFNDDVKAFAIMDLDEKKEAIDQQLREMRESEAEVDKLEKLEKERKEEGNTLTKEEKGRLWQQGTLRKNAVKNSTLLFTSAAEQGQLDDLMEHAIKDDANLSFLSEEQKDGWNTKEKRGQFIQMLISQKSVLGEDGKFSMEMAQENESDLRGILKNKWNLTMNGLMRGLNTNAEKNQDASSYNQVRRGVNSNGIRTMGFAQNMDAGVGHSDNEKALVSNIANMSGEAMRRGKQEFLTGEVADLSRVTDGRTVFKVDSKGMVMAIDEGNKKLVRSMAAMTSSQLLSLHRSHINMMTGGDYENSSYDGRNFNVKHADAAENFKDMMKEFTGSINTAAASGNQQTYDREVKRLVDFMYRATGKKLQLDQIQKIKINVEGQNEESSPGTFEGLKDFDRTVNRNGGNNQANNP